MPFRSTAQSFDSSPERLSEPGSITKAQFARRFIKEHAAEGFTSADLLNAFRDGKVEIQKTYLYSLIQRFEDQKVICQKNSRYYFVADSEK
jgi:hypothetical protein